MKYIIALSAILFSLTAVAAHAPAASKQDEETLKWIMAVDKFEVSAGKEVLPKTKNAQVKDFAEMMIKQHGENLKQAEALGKKDHITPMESDATKQLEEKGQKELQTLKPLHGAELDKNYMTAMRDGHKEVLDNLDQNILPKIQNAGLKTFAEDFRKHVEHHYTVASDVLNKLGNS